MRSTAVVIVGALALAGCGAGDPSEPEPTGAASRSPAAAAPVLGASHELVPDPSGDGLLILSGPPELEPAGDPLQLWRWDGVAWTAVPAAGDVPPQRSYFASAFDAGRDVVSSIHRASGQSAAAATGRRSRPHTGMTVCSAA